MLKNHDGNVNILHYSIVKLTCVARSVPAAKLCTAVHAFDYATTIRSTSNDSFHYSASVTLYTGSESLYDGIFSMNVVTEKRLFIDLRILCESHEVHELSNFIWIPSSQNPVNVMTKDAPSSAPKRKVNNRLE